MRIKKKNKLKKTSYRSRVKVTVPVKNELIKNSKKKKKDRPRVKGDNKKKKTFQPVKVLK